MQRARTRLATRPTNWIAASMTSSRFPTNAARPRYQQRRHYSRAESFFETVRDAVGSAQTLQQRRQTLVQVQVELNRAAFLDRRVGTLQLHAELERTVCRQRHVRIERIEVEILERLECEADTGLRHHRRCR